MQLSEALQGYLLACKVNNISEKTMIGYEYNLKNFIEVVGDMPVIDLSPNHIRVFMVHEMDRKNSHNGKPLSSETRMKSYTVVRAFARWLYNQDLTPHCVTDKTKAPRTEQLMPEVLSKDEIHKIFEYLDIAGTYRDKVIWEFFLDTGCRLSEVSRLELDDINLLEGWARVYGKGRKEGIVPMGNRLCEDLHRYINRYRRAPSDEMKVFCSNKAPYRGLTKDGLQMLIKRVHKAIGIKGKYGPHVLRHTMATQFIANGGDVSILRRILRHTDIKTTQRYVNLAASDIIASHRNNSPIDRMK